MHKMDEIVKKFQIEYPKVVKSMKQADHHYNESEVNPYHIESDVWTHTMMVCLKMKDKLKSDESSDELLMWCALLHDIGKPICREVKEETKRVRFFGHEPVGAFMAIDILQDQGFSPKDIVRGFQLIAMHTEHFKIGTDKLAKRCVNQQKLLNDLFCLSDADRHGRFFQNEEENVETFGKKVSTNPENPSLQNEVVCMVGLPCSGKSTYIKKKFDDSYVIISRDAIVEEIGEGANYNEKFKSVDQKKVNKILDERKKQAIKEKKNVILDLTHMSRKSRRSSMGSFPKSYKRKAVVVLAGMRDIMDRNEKREGKYIPSHVYESMTKAFYPPMYDEFQEIKWAIN